MARLSGKVAIVAGAAFGIGRATATIMAREGARVILGDYDADAAAAAAEAIRSGGGEAHSIYFDATREESVRELVAKTKERYGRIDIMHNNVGGTEPGKDVNVVEMDLGAWERILKLTLYSAMYGCRHVIPVMLETGGGAIVNTASMSGAIGDAGLTAYGAAKAGVINLTRYVATQYGRRNIRCNAVAPGLILTERANEVVTPASPEDLRGAQPGAAQRPPRRYRQRRRFPRLRRRGIHHRPGAGRGRRDVHPQPHTRRHDEAGLENLALDKTGDALRRPEIAEDRLMARMAGKVAIVTGAAQGIGEATATIMAREGAKVVVADYNTDGAKAVAEAIRGKGGEAHALFVDATREESVRELIAKSKERYGFVNVMHNNVGGTEPVKDVAVADIDVADWDAIFNLTLKSTLFGCKHVIPLMLEHGGGAIVNTASMAGVHGGLGLSAYGGAKSGVIGLTRYVATQYGRHHIRCNAVAPGLIVTPRASELIPENVRNVFAAHNLVPRNGTPEDIGYTVTFLASDEAGFITGQVIQVDGGSLAHGPTMVDLMKIGVMM